MAAKRLNPDYAQISGLIRKGVFLQFKSECTLQERQMSEVLEEIIEKWLQEQKAKKDEDRAGKDT